MSHLRTKDLIAGVLFGACIAITMALIVVGVLLKTKQGEDPVTPEPVEEAYEPYPWKGSVVCKHGNMQLYSVDGLVFYRVSAQPAGWLWEMFQEDGTVIFYHQPERVFCSAIPEENDNE